MDRRRDYDRADDAGVVVIPHEKAPVDAPLTKTVVRRGVEGGDAARVGTTCYGACISDVGFRRGFCRSIPFERCDDGWDED